MPKITNLEDFQASLWSFASHRVLTSASRTGLLGALSGRSLTPEAAAAELNLDPVAVAKMLRALADLGVLERNPTGQFTLSQIVTSAFDNGQSLAPFLDHSHHLYDSWGESLETWLRGGTWTSLPRDSEGIRRFSDAMRSMAKAVAPQVALALDLRSTKKAIDFGGGTGEYARALCRANQELSVTVVDTPAVAAFGAAELEDELSERIEFLGGDYMEADCGGCYDLALIINVLHQENEDRAERLIGRAAKTLKPGGRLAIVDFALAEDGGSEIGALFALNMRGFGDTYSAEQIRRWMYAAGLIHVQKTNMGQHRMLVVGHRSR